MPPFAARPAVTGTRPRFGWRRRRLLRWVLVAALLAAAVVTPAFRGEDGVVALTAAADLPAGHRLSEADLVESRFPAELVPDSAATAVPDVDGATLTSGLRRGEVVTDIRITGPEGDADRHRVVPVPVADSGLAAHLRPGAVVDVIALTPARPDAVGAPEPPDHPARDADSPTPDVLASDAVVVDVGEASAGRGTTLLLRLPEASAHHVAARALDTPLTVTSHG